LTVEDNIAAVLEMTRLSKSQQRDKLEMLLDEFGLGHVRKNGVICCQEVKEDAQNCAVAGG
jgi:ABC-type lipopolysaccharide export system ATPase subunit